MRFRLALTALFIANFLASGSAAWAVEPSALKFSVSFDPSVRDKPASGRLVVYLVRDGTRVSPTHKPADGFIEHDPQPLFGIDVHELKPGESVTVDDSATSFPAKLDDLPAGRYRAQAVLDLKRENSEWSREAGNLYSDVIRFDAHSPGAAEPVKILLKHVVRPSAPQDAGNVRFVAVRSKLLSNFRGHDVYLRAGIALPVNYDPNRAYPAVYEVPGYGGDHTMAFYKAARRARREPGSPAQEIAHNTFWIFLDPESPNGHTLFVDSDVNGPCGKALTTELIPAIESRFKLVSEPRGRIVTGHSSGGWSSLWLATEYPDVFGACWSSSPDPIDFRKFELVDIYSADNLYVDAAGKEMSSARFDGESTLTTRQENGMEQVLGPGNDSAQQWDSWQAAWGHRNPDGGVRPLYDPITGKIDHAESETYRRFDIVDRLRKDPGRFVPIFRERIRVVCGSEDNYYLNEAVALLKHDLEALDPPDANDTRPGYIKLAPGDHSSVARSPEMQAWPGEMIEYLRREGLTPR